MRGSSRREVERKGTRWVWSGYIPLARFRYAVGDCSVRRSWVRMVILVSFV